MPPLVVIGIDGLPPALLERWLAAGELPTLGSLARSGCRGVLRSTPNYQSAAAWTSIVTGVNPGRHGIFHFTNPVAGSYELTQIDARARRAPTLWRMLSDAGLRVAALNFPVSYPAEQVNGVQVGGWLAPDDSSPGFTHPPELAAELAGRFGRYLIQPQVRRDALRGNWDAVVEAAVAGITHKARVARWLAEQENWDLLGVVFVETDSVQHWCWGGEDPLGGPSGEAIRRVYRALDEELAGLLQRLQGSDVLVISDHGQMQNSGGQVLLRGWLAERGNLTLRAGSARRGADRLLARAFNAMKNRLPNALKVRLRQRAPGLMSRAQAATRGGEPDWARTRAWVYHGHIYVNLRDRQPQGIVEPGPEHEELLEELTARLVELRDPAGGRPAVASVTRGAEEFSGPYAHIMPDLLVHWHGGPPLQALTWRDARGRTQQVRRPDGLTLPVGAHHPDGVLLACGPSFGSGVESARRNVCDITPTVLHLLGRPVPSYLDGKVATELLTKRAGASVRIVDQPAPDVPPASAAAGAESATVRERLRGLGYLE